MAEDDHARIVDVHRGRSDELIASPSCRGVSLLEQGELAGAFGDH